MQTIELMATERPWQRLTEQAASASWPYLVRVARARAEFSPALDGATQCRHDQAVAPTPCVVAKPPCSHTSCAMVGSATPERSTDRCMGSATPERSPDRGQGRPRPRCPWRVVPTPSCGAAPASSHRGRTRPLACAQAAERPNARAATGGTCAATRLRRAVAPLPSRWGRGHHAASERAQDPRPRH